MANKFHVSADGNPHQCFASLRPCPLGGEDNHYGSVEEARAGFEAKMAGETFNPVGKTGYTITSLIQTGEPQSKVHAGPMQRLPIKGGFATPEDAIKWAEDNLSDATELVNLTNEDYAGPRMNDKGDILQSEPGYFKTLNLIDISKERQALDTHDVPTIGRHYIETHGDRIKDVHSMRLYTWKASHVLTPEELGRVRGYIKAATYGKKS